VHDRRIDGISHTFGNAGTLFMSAMTWYDHETGSIWSQPWGRAIKGELKGVELRLLPFQLTTWASWEKDHPETLVMTNDVNRLGLRGRQGFSPDFVIALVLADQAKAYYFRDAQSTGIINDHVGDIPVVLWAGEDNWYAYIREVDNQELTFRIEGEMMSDEETGSKWDITRGLAIEGPLGGTALQAVPSLSSFDWAFVDFYPQGEFYTK
jgi:hypothetical protein